MSDIMDDDASSYDYDQEDMDYYEETQDDLFVPKQDHVKETLEFKSLTVSQLQAVRQEEINQVSSIVGTSSPLAAILLGHFGWNKEKLLEKYMEDPDNVCQDAGICLKEEERVAFQNLDNFFCFICCEEYPNVGTLGLSCNHRYCLNCYRTYVEGKIMDEGECRRINCPADCKLALPETIIGELISSKAFEKYQYLSLRNYVDDMEYFRFCTAADCENIIECHVFPASFDRVVPVVVCSCNNAFCFGCGLSDHLPVPCFLMKKWLRKCEDDSETANWISVNTKECSKCQATIEKNGGCNHMSCRKCRHEFCWVCLGPWSEHGSQWYSCNRFNEKSSEEARDVQSKSRIQLKRYLHYYDRYANHEQSAKMENQLTEKTEKKMEEIQQTTDLSWIEVQFFKKAVQVLVQCRTTIQHTYAFAFFLAKNNMTEIFESNQRDLEIAVESLSELLEKQWTISEIPSLKQQVLDKTVYVSSRRAILLEDTAKGLLEDRWSYLDDSEINVK